MREDGRRWEAMGGDRRRREKEGEARRGAHLRALKHAKVRLVIDVHSERGRDVAQVGERDAPAAVEAGGGELRGRSEGDRLEIGWRSVGDRREIGWRSEGRLWGRHVELIGR